ncbi:MAG: hypothetical protein CVV63_04785, partial [Tenericutes bacterium HGW-Tenericutes-8]
AFLDLFKTLWAEQDIQTLVKTILSLPHWETDRLSQPDVLNYVTQMVELISSKGMKVALKQVLEAL